MAINKPLCAACDGCPVCAVSDCCVDCTADVYDEGGGEFICECVGHTCGPGPDEVEPEPEEPPEDDSYVPGDYDLEEGP